MPQMRSRYGKEEILLPGHLEMHEMSMEGVNYE